MSSTIKPPGAPGAPTSPLPEIAPTQGAEGTQGAKPAFHETLQADGVGPADPIARATSAEPIEALTEDLRAGRIGGAEAVEALIGRALSTPMARSLTAAARAELEAHLRASLEHDPSMVAMTKDLERAR